MKLTIPSQAVPFASIAVLLTLTACSSSNSDVGGPGEYQQEFDLAHRTLATTGRNAYFVLEPGYQLELADDETKLVITVLDDTKMIDGVMTRVVEERETEKGDLVEVSRNYFAVDSATNDVFYFGEDVDTYVGGKLHGHPGAWHAGENGARAGLIAPGTPRVGMRYHQELAPHVAMDRARVLSLDATLKTPAGEFKRCMRTIESSALDKKLEGEYKVYAPGVGLIQDEDLLLVRSGKVGTR